MHLSSVMTDAMAGQPPSTSLGCPHLRLSVAKPRHHRQTPPAQTASSVKFLPRPSLGNVLQGRGRIGGRFFSPMEACVAAGRVFGSKSSS